MNYIALFTKAGIRSYAIKRNKSDDRSIDGLRIATMHRVKGLEFKYVFILTLLLVLRTQMSIWLADVNGRVVKSIVEQNFSLFCKRVSSIV